jgi:hypothetical protein
VGREVTLEIGDRVWPRRAVAVMDLSTALAAYQERVDGPVGDGFSSGFLASRHKSEGPRGYFHPVNVTQPASGRIVVVLRCLSVHYVGINSIGLWPF